MRTIAIFDATRERYEAEEMTNRCLSVGELRDVIEGLEDDDIIMLSHDGGYTYGTLELIELVDECGIEDWKNPTKLW